MRRLICSLSCFLVLALCIFPAFVSAEEVTEPIEATPPQFTTNPNQGLIDWLNSFGVRADFTIDEMTLLNGVYEDRTWQWPFNNSSAAGGYSFTAEQDGLFYGRASAYQGRTRDVIDVDFIAPDASEIRLWSNDMIYERGKAQWELTSTYENLIFTEVYVAFKICYLDQSGNRYLVRKTGFCEYSYQFDPNEHEKLVVDLDLLIGDAYDHYKLVQDLPLETLPSSYIYLSDVNIQVKYFHDPSDNGDSLLRIISTAQTHFDWYDWFNSIYVYAPYDDELSGVIGWVFPVLEGFFEFEIMPGMSIDSLFYLIIIIGLVLWFLTLLI